jgi:hypothetical protein
VNAQMYYNTGKLLQGLVDGVNGPLLSKASAVKVSAPLLTVISGFNLAGKLVAGSGTTITLQWPGSVNQSYLVEWATSPTGPWSELPSIITGVEPVTSTTLTASGDAAFYRVKVISGGP